MAEIALDRLAGELLRARGTAERFIVAIAGPPASGKSTLSAALNAELNARAEGRSVVVPMDGYHLDNDRLDDLNLRNRKGAPETFDFDGFLCLIQRLRAPERPVYIPTFDRALDKAIAGQGVVRPEDQIILVEGNYLLLDEDPWSQLRPAFDYSIFLDTPMETLRARLIQRWIDHDHSRADAEARALSNDIPNAIRVCEGFLKADQVIQSS
ncbi:MAG: nucleoside triphosphate hydrolase [Pseudomonadota bacterium]